MKECFKCKTSKPIDCFYKHPQMTDGHVNKCKECNKVDVRENYSKKVEYYRDYDKKRQRLSIDRILSHRYNSIKARCEKDYASAKARNYKVTGMAYLSRKEFMVWADKNMESFMAIYNDWAKSGYDTRLMPSVDRIDAKLGYIPSNMQWLSKSDNSKKLSLVDYPGRWKRAYKTRYGKEYEEN